MTCLIIMMVVLTGGCLVLGWINYKINKLKDESKLNIETIGSIIALEKAMKKLNEALRTESRSLSDYKQRLRSLEKRIDILESGHPNSEFDYAITDDHDNIVEVWVDGKKYILEDKPDSDVMKLYADNKVVAETTRPGSRYTCADCERFRRKRIDGKWCGICSVDNVIMSNDELYICDKFRLYKPIEYYGNKNMAETTRPEETRCCATCQHYRPGSGCARKPWLNRSQRMAMYATSACNNYEEVSTPCVSSDKGKVEYSYTTYKDMGGNARTEQLTKMIDDLNYFYNVGLMSTATYMHRWEELMQK